MRKYLAFYRLRFERTLLYRSSVIVFRLQNVLMLVTLSAIWLASKSTGDIGGYSKNSLISYYLVGSMVNAMVFWYAGGNIRTEIRDGEIAAKALLKPASYYWSKFFEEFSWHTVAPLFALVSTGIVAYFLRANLVISGSWQTWLFMGLSIIFSSVIFFNLTCAIALLTFWFSETMGIFNLVWAGIFLLGGQAIPISFFPGNIGTVVKVLPFRYIYSFPLEIYSGKLTFEGIFIGLVAQLVWIGVFGLAYIFLWRRGVEHYSAYGG